MYYKIVKGKLCPAPKNIEKLIGKPTPKQYLFFGYKPLSGETPSSGEDGYTYVEEEKEIRCVKVK